VMRSKSWCVPNRTYAVSVKCDWYTVAFKRNSSSWETVTTFSGDPLEYWWSIIESGRIFLLGVYAGYTVNLTPVIQPVDQRLPKDILNSNIPLVRERRFAVESGEIR